VNEKKPRTLLIGLDAACWEYLDPLLEAGRLPTIRKLMDEGVWGVLRSTLPASTPVAWSSIITGKNPGKHGVFDMLWKKPGTYQFHPTSLPVRQGTPFWEHLNAHGVRVGLINVPFSYPLPRVDGFALAGFGAPDSARELTYPPELMDWITENVGHYVAPSKLYDLRKQLAIPEIVRLEHDHQATLVEVANRLHEKSPVDVLVINLMLLDHVNHLDQDLVVVGKALEQMDRDLASIVASFKPDNIMAISDHGSRQVDGIFYLHNWLLQNGYTIRAPRSPEDRKKALNSLASEWLKLVYGPQNMVEKILRRLVILALDAFPGGIGKPLWERICARLPNARDYVNLTARIDYDQALTYRASVYSGNIYVNLAGRDGKGVVPPEQRTALLDELAEKLLALKDPTGAPLFDGAYKSEDLYAGPGLAYAPDLVLDGYRSSWNASFVYPGLQVGGDYLKKESRHEGWHSRDGIYIYCGDAFGSGHSERLRSVLDIPATLLAIYDIPIPDDFDGQAMEETFDPAWREAHPIGTQPGDPLESYRYDLPGYEENNEMLLAQLRALGYVD
jgi:predicted AlkP superfamily phosphohydrolase/phosphomutase